jgi:hypothetical protein
MTTSQKVTIECAYCHNTFQDFVSNGRKYCCRLCYTNSKNGKQLSETIRAHMRGHPAWNKGKRGIFSPETLEQMRISHLGKSPANKGIAMTPQQKRRISQATKGIKKPSLSISARKRVGPLSPRWKGGLTPQSLRLRHNIQTQEWRRAVFARDDYVCQFCFQRGGRLNAHHLFRVSQYPSLIWELGNGITLCEDCHRFYHSHGTDPTTWHLNMLYLEGSI